MNDLKIIAREIHAAIRDGHTELAKKLLKDNLHLGILHYKTPFGTWLHDAALYGRKDVLEYLVLSGFNINERGGTFGGTALSEAISSEFFDIVEYLLDLNVDMITSDSVQNPLFTAIVKGNLDIVKVLIKYGIDYKISYSGEYANNLDAEAFALERGEKELADYLHHLKG